MDVFGATLKSFCSRERLLVRAIAHQWLWWLLKQWFYAMLRNRFFNHNDSTLYYLESINSRFCFLEWIWFLEQCWNPFAIDFDCSRDWFRLFSRSINLIWSIVPTSNSHSLRSLRQQIHWTNDVYVHYPGSLFEPNPNTIVLPIGSRERSLITKIKIRSKIASH